MDKIFLAFGSSITYGAWDLEGGGWVGRLRKFLDQRNLLDKGGFFLLYNLGIDGDDTERLLKRFETESETRLSGWENESRVIIFEIGTNDSCYRGAKNNFAVLPKKFENNLLDLIKKTKGLASEVVFLGLAKGSDKETMPFPSSVTGKCYNKENIAIYNNIIKKVCEKEEIPFIDILNNMIDEDFYDGLHPNSSGHQKIFEIVKGFLIGNKAI